MLRVGVPLGLIAAFAALLAYAARDALLPAQDVMVAPVIIKTAAGGAAAEGAVIAQAAGWVEPDPYPVHVTALTDGVVEEVLVLEGQPVKAGQVVARLVDEDAHLALARAEAERNQMEAEVELAEATLTAAQAQWDNPVERERAVAAAEAMLAENRAELERLPSEVAAADATAREAREQAARLEKMGERAASAFEIVSAKLKAEALEATAKSTRARLGVLEAKVRAAQAEHQAARENLRLRIGEARALGEAKAGLAKAQSAARRAVVMRAEAKLRLDRTDVKSPVNGVVMTRLAEPGAKVMFGGDDPQAAQVVHLYDPKKLQVRVDVPLADAGKVGVGARAKIVVGVLPDKEFDGVVTRVVHQADVQKNTQQFKVAIHDPAAEIKPEMLARVKLLGEGKGDAGGATRSVAYVPDAAVHRSSNGEATAWIIDQGRSAATLRQIRVSGSAPPGWAMVTSGLQAGDRVIVGDVSQLAEGKRIRIKGEAQAPPGMVGDDSVKGADHVAH